MRIANSKTFQSMITIEKQWVQKITKRDESSFDRDTIEVEKISQIEWVERVHNLITMMAKKTD